MRDARDSLQAARDDNRSKSRSPPKLGRKKTSELWKHMKQSKDNGTGKNRTHCNYCDMLKKPLLIQGYPAGLPQEGLCSIMRYADTLMWGVI